MKKNHLFFEVVWPLILVFILIMLPTFYDAFAKEDKPKVDKSFFLEESEKSFQMFQNVTNQANKTISNKVESIKKEVASLKNEVKEISDELKLSEEKNANYESKIKQMDSIGNPINSKPFDILAILPDSAR